jgi:hypothetical protein
VRSDGPRSAKGHLLLGQCWPDISTPVAQPDSDKEIRQLRDLVIELNGEIAALRDQMAVQYNELMSEIDFLKSALEHKADKSR